MNLLKPGTPVKYTISYVNGRKSSFFYDDGELAPFINVLLTMQYDPFLTFVETDHDASKIDTTTHTITWDIGTLEPGEGDTYTVTFTLANEIPMTIYEINTSVTINGVNSKQINNRPGDYDKVTLYIEGHPTPTSLATDIPKPTELSTTAPIQTETPINSLNSTLNAPSQNKPLIEWLLENLKWIFSGIGVSLCFAFFNFIKTQLGKKHPKSKSRIEVELPNNTEQTLCCEQSNPLKQIVETDFGLVAILFLAADPTDASRLMLGKEFDEIQNELKLAKLRDRFKLELPRLSLRPVDISQAMLDVKPKIVHFSGHGTADGALCFENNIGQAQLIQPDALAKLFEQFASQVNCVVLNACYSELQAEAIARHIEYVVGMNQAIGDSAAIAFTIGFYQALGAGCTIEEAFKLGCAQIGLQSFPEHLTPVLKSFGLKILGILNRPSSGSRTIKEIRDGTDLDISIVSKQLGYLKKHGYVKIKRTNGKRWVITDSGKKLLEDTGNLHRN